MEPFKLNAMFHSIRMYIAQMSMRLPADEKLSFTDIYNANFAASNSDAIALSERLSVLSNIVADKDRYKSLINVVQINTLVKPPKYNAKTGFSPDTFFLEKEVQLYISEYATKKNQIVVWPELFREAHKDLNHRLKRIHRKGGVLR